MLDLFAAIILAIVEGITEFLPISSTGHMIIVAALMKIAPTDFVKLFIVCIQLGCIMSVFFLYFKRFFQSWQFYFKIFVAFIPAVIAGLLLKDYIDAMLESPITVGFGLLIGGIILLFIDKLLNNQRIDDTNNLPYKSAFITGCYQVLAMVPGVSRSAATIIGGMQQGMTRKAAAEFSFFLAMPTMLGATVKSLYDYSKTNVLQSEQINLLLIGNVIAFVIGIFAMKFLVNFLTKKGFCIFGWYRIIVGALIIILVYTGVIKEMIG